MEAKDTPWQRLSRSIVYRGYINLVRDRVRLPSGRELDYELVLQRDCAAALVKYDSAFVLVRQFRYATGKFEWELPMGGVEEGETDEAAARREVGEESGFVMAGLRHIGTIVPSNGNFTQRIHIYYGVATSVAPRRLDPTEDISVETFPARTLVSMVLDGEITDAATAYGILMAHQRGIL